jgi:molybdate transport system substrate-binding protein
MRILFRGFAASVLVAVALIAGTAQAADVVVFAAASTKDAVDDIAEAFQAAGHGKILTSYGASSELAKQIEHGALANIYISADTKWMDYLAQKNLIVSSSRRDLLGNHLVLIAPIASTLAIDLKPLAPLAQALGDGKLAMCDPDSVPAGRYAKASLTSLGIWDAIAPKVANAKDVRAALALVERGEAPAGVVYSTDAMLSKKVRVVATFPDDTHPKIIYPVALVTGHDDVAAHAFYDYLTGPEAAAIFEKYGFIILH